MKAYGQGEAEPGLGHKVLGDDTRDDMVGDRLLVELWVTDLIDLKRRSIWRHSVKPTFRITFISAMEGRFSIPRGLPSISLATAWKKEIQYNA